MKKEIFKSGPENKLGYFVYLPEDYSGENKYPLIVSLHGAGERGNGSSELENVNNIGFGRYFKEKLMELPCIVLCPQCPADNVWTHLIDELKELILKIEDSYSVDTSRVSITGMSMGGYGSWEMGMTFPEMFSAVAPICGGGMAWRAGALRGKPVWAFHGEIDNVVNINESREMVERAHAGGANVKFTIFWGVQHNSWDPAYLDTKVIDWLIAQKNG